MIRSSDFTASLPVRNILTKVACFVVFVRPSVAFLELLTKQIFEIFPVLYPFLVAAIYSISLFSDVQDPFDRTSNNDLLSAYNVKGTSLPVNFLSAEESVNEASNMLLNAMISAATTDIVTLLVL